MDVSALVKRKQFTVRMSQKEKDRLAAVAERRGIPQATVLRVLVNEEYQRMNGGPFGEPIKVPV